MLSQSVFIDDAVIIVRQGTKRKEEELLTIRRQYLDFQQKEQSKLLTFEVGPYVLYLTAYKIHRCIRHTTISSGQNKEEISN